jgi:Domain of unknown function (DUF4352)
LLSSVFAACSGNPDSSPVTNNSTPVSTQAQSTPVSTPPPSKVSEQVAVGTTWLITLTKVSLSSGDNSYTPPEGKQLLVLSISEQNRSGQEASVNGAADWKLQDSTGASFKVVKTAYGEMPVDQVEAGGVSSGELVYEIPTSGHHFTLTFAPMSGDGHNVWDVTV